MDNGIATADRGRAILPKSPDTEGEPKMTDTVRHIEVSRLGSATAKAGKTVFLVDYEDGAAGTLSIPAEEGGRFIDWIHRTFYGVGGGQSLPEVDVLRMGLAQDPTGKIVLKIDTAQAHAIVCMLSREQAAFLRDKLGDVDSLPLASPAMSH